MSRLDDYKKTFKSVPKKIKDTLRRQRWNEALIFFFFILLSLGFWLLQSLQQDYEIELSIPVRYKNVPPNIAFTTTPPESILIKVKDKGSVLLNYTLGRTFMPIVADLKQLSATNGEYNMPRKEIESDIMKQLLATTTMQGFEPQSISLKYNLRKKKLVPVVFNGKIQTEAGFFVSDSVKIKPAQVEVYGSEALLDSIQFVRTVFLETKNINKTYFQQLAIDKIEGVVIVPEIVTVTAKVEEYTEKILNIPIICTNLPENLTLRTFPSVAQISCNIPLSQFKDLKETDFSITIDYSELEQNLNGSISIHVTRKPDWVRNVTVSPSKIEFVLEQNNKSND